MDENRKNTIEVEMTEDDWMELLQVCIDLRVTPDTLIESFCGEVIRSSHCCASSQTPFAGTLLHAAQSNGKEL